ncbi:MAG: HAMP domain-containing sensor histidine kinase [Pseudomonadota bacterium]
MRISARPRSIFSLILLGYALVALPIIVVSAVAAIYAKNLADDSNRLLNSGVRVIQRSQALEDSLIAIDRMSQQYRVLGQAQSLDTFAKREIQANAALADLRLSPQYRQSDWQLERIASDVKALDAALQLNDPKAPELARALEKFGEVHKLANGITDQAQMFIANEASAIEQRATKHENFLITLGAFLLPIACGMALLSAYYVIFPLRKLDRVIKDLGADRLDKPISVRGPQELQRLGQELDWLRTRLLTVDQDKNRFLRQMAHELKTPLANVREAVELLAEGVTGSLTEQQVEVVGILNNNSFELQTLIENLLDFEDWREKAGRMDLSFFPMRPLIDRCVQRYRVLITARHLTFSVKCEQFQVYADRERLRMTLDNLISNAIKFSPQSGTIFITARLEAGMSNSVKTTNELEIEIADEGPGIPANDRNNIFDPYFTGKPPAGRHLQGTGIGLAVVNDCVKAHGGTIVVVDRPTSGACFKIRLPIEYERASVSVAVPVPG